MDYLIEFQVEKNQEIIHKSILLSLVDFAIREREIFGGHFDWFVSEGFINFLCNTNLEVVLKILNSGCFNKFENFKSIDEGLATIIDIEIKNVLKKMDLILDNSFFNNITYLSIEKL